MEEHETISGDDARRIVNGQKMQDNYKVKDIEKDEDDLMDQSLFEKRYGHRSQEEATQKTALSTDEVTTLLAREITKKRLKEEEEVFEMLLREKNNENNDKDFTVCSRQGRLGALSFGASNQDGRIEWQSLFLSCPVLEVW